MHMLGLIQLQELLKRNLSDKILIRNKSFNPNEYEKKILRKIFEWPKIIESASYKLEPHKIPFYLYELSTLISLILE